MNDGAYITRVTKYKDIDTVPCKDLPRVINDLQGIIDELGINEEIHLINIHCTNKDIKEKELKKIIDNMNYKSIYLYESIASTYEYPESLYYVEGMNNDTKGKLPLDINKAVEIDSKIAEGLGFESINNYTRSFCSNPLIYPNKTGREILDFINSED